jgi:hypothetical protein
MSKQSRKELSSSELSSPSHARAIKPSIPLALLFIILELWRYISRKIGVKLEPYDCRRSPSGWLRDLYLSDIAIGQYDATTGEGT